MVMDVVVNVVIHSGRDEKPGLWKCGTTLSLSLSFPALSHWTLCMIEQWKCEMKKEESDIVYVGWLVGDKRRCDGGVILWS